MSGTDCNYQRKVTVQEIAEALAEAACHHCGVTTSELMQKGEILEVCGEEFASEIENGKQALVAVALCSDCHKHHHLDANRQHNPCQVKARLSREGLTRP